MPKHVAITVGMAGFVGWAIYVVWGAIDNREEGALGGIAPGLLFGALMFSGLSYLMVRSKWGWVSWLAFIGWLIVALVVPAATLGVEALSPFLIIFNIAIGAAIITGIGMFRRTAESGMTSTEQATEPVHVYRWSRGQKIIFSTLAIYSIFVYMLEPVAPFWMLIAVLLLVAALVTLVGFLLRRFMR